EDPTGHNQAPVENRGRSPVPYLTSLGHLEAVARPTHCLEVTRALRVALDLLTDTPDIDIDRARRHEAGISPDRIQQVVAAEDAPRMPRKIVKQTELRSRGGGQLTANLELHRAGIDDDFLEADYRGCGWPLEAPQHSLDARNQLAHG